MRDHKAWLFTLLAAGLLSVTACSDDEGTDDTSTGDTTTDSTDTGETDTTVTTETDTTVTTETDTTETDTTDVCGPRECGTFAGVECGTCDTGETCTVAGVCRAPRLGMGAFCGVTADCDPEAADWPGCLSDQCDGFCSSDSGSFFGTKDVCTAACQIYADSDSNGVNDVGAQSDCNPGNITDGPSGNAFRCLNIAGPGQNEQGVCLPGTEFPTCNADSDCSPGEGCEFLNTAAGLGFRCMTKNKVAPGVDAIALLGQDCNTDPVNGPISLCESGLCLGAFTDAGVGEGACLTRCGQIAVDGVVTDAQQAFCDTTAAYADTGCDTVAGTCIGRSSRACTADIDCSSSECAQFFGDIADAGFCQNKECGSDADCGGAFYCGLADGLALDADDNIVLPSECSIQTIGGAEVGEACDPELNDAEIINEGAECSNTGQCDGGFCSGLCSVDGDCGTDQLCTVGEISGTATIDAEGTTADYDIFINQCTSFPSATTDCLADSECGDGEVCRIYQLANEGDVDAPYTLNGKCIARQGFATGNNGDLFTPASAAWICGNPGAALGVELTDGTQAVLCSEICQDHAGCAEVAGQDGPEQGQCVPFGIGAGGDLDSDRFRLQAGVCFPLFDESSLEDCSTDFSCTEGTETCSWTALINDPTKAATLIFACYEVEAEGAALGATCEADGDCASLHCIEDDQGGANFCSTPCATGGNACDAGSLACRSLTLNARQGAYVANSAVIDACQKAL